MYCHAAIHGNALDAAREEQAERKEWAWQAARGCRAGYGAVGLAPYGRGRPRQRRKGYGTETRPRATFPPFQQRGAE